MPCNHKFQDDLQLSRLTFTPQTLIIGTFNPQWPDTNTAEWFYGRTDTNHFWDILPRLHGDSCLISATPAQWKQYCQTRHIALTDFISAIDDATPDSRNHQKILGGFSDDAIIHNFEDFTYVAIVQLLRQHPSIKNVYITRSVTDAFWRFLWNPVAHYCSQHNIHTGILLTPTAESAYHHTAHNQQHPHSTAPTLQDYLLTRWQQQWHQ